MSQVPYNTITGGGYTGGTNPLTNTAEQLYYTNPAYYQEAELLPVSGGGTGVSGGGSGLDTNFVNQAYDTKIAGLRGILDTYDPQQQNATLQVNNQYTNQANALQGQRAIGQRNLGIAREQNSANKVRGLADLRRQVETQGMSYQNQLGAYGAGDSSANGLINQALSGMASKNRSNVLNETGQQERAINLQGQDLEFEYENNLKSLDDWKSSTLNDIATKFMQQKQLIQQQMQSADADRYQALAQADASYTQQAIEQLAQLENQYRTNAQDLVGRYQNISGPSVALNPQLQQFQVTPISQQRLGQLSVVPQASAGNQPLGVRRSFEEDYGFGL